MDGIVNESRKHILFSWKTTTASDHDGLCETSFGKRTVMVWTNVEVWKPALPISLSNLFFSNFSVFYYFLPLWFWFAFKRGHFDTPTLAARSEEVTITLYKAYLIYYEMYIWWKSKISFSLSAGYADFFFFFFYKEEYYRLYGLGVFTVLPASMLPCLMAAVLFSKFNWPIMRQDNCLCI